MDPSFRASEIPLLRSRLAEMFRAQPGKVLFCTDLRALDRFAPEDEEPLIKLMQSDNPRIERSAFLVGTGKFSMQVLRMVQEAEHRSRRVFRERAALEAWLGETATPAERARLAEFLDGGDS